MDEFASFGTWLKHRRRELDLTQAELAQRAGCSEAAIRKIEADERKPSRQLAGLLAKELRVSDADKETFIRLARRILPETKSFKRVTAAAGAPDFLRAAVSSNNLPAFLTSLIDRAKDIAVVLELITGGEARWVTLIGPPGIGKTRLSIHCGEQASPHFRDGVWFVDLSAIQNVELVFPAIGRCLHQFDLPQSPSLEQLMLGLREKELLLILDNFEQVEAAASHVVSLLKACPKVKALISSRVPLNVYGEYKYYVPSLSVPPKSAAKSPESLMRFEAVQLFVARAGQFQTGFKITPENAEAIINICTRMDGIPLALELAAASLRHMSLSELVGLLHVENETNWLKHIEHPARDLPPRQQTLENVIAWSYALLSPERQLLFRKLGIFTDLFDSEAAANVCDENAMDAGRTRSELESLADHSLLQQSVVDGHSYWHMLEIIDEFALMQTTPIERSNLGARHAKYYQSLLKNMLSSSEKMNFESFFQVHGGNLHQALRWAVSAENINLAFSLAIDLGEIWERVGYLREGMDLIQKVSSMSGTADNKLRIEFLERAATLAWQLHHFDFALSLTDTALEIAKSNQLNSAHPMLLNLQGRIFIEQGKYHEAYPALSECYELSLSDPAAFNAGVPLAQLGEIELAFGNYDQARSTLSRALGYLKGKDDIFLAMSMTDLAEVALAERNYREAQRQLQYAKNVAGRNVRRLLCYLSTLSGYLTLDPQSDQKLLQRAVEIYSAIHALEEHSGIELVPFYMELNMSRLELTRLKLEKGRWEIAWEAGRQWAQEKILSQAIEGII